MLQQAKQRAGKRSGGSSKLLGPKLMSSYREIEDVTNDLLKLSRPVLKKALDTCLFELPLDSVESKGNDSSDGQLESSGDTDGEVSDEMCRQKPATVKKLVHWGVKRELPPIYMNLGEFQIGNNSLDFNNSGQGVDMQNMPSIAEQLERQRTWMNVYFRYRMNWYEAKSTLATMSRDTAYKAANLPLWTRYVKVQLHRKTIFLNAIRAFRNRMQCATSGVRFTLHAFYREIDKKQYSDIKLGPEPKPLPFFRCPDDMPDIRSMVNAQLNVFVSNSTSYFDMFWDECLKD